MLSVRLMLTILFNSVLNSGHTVITRLVDLVACCFLELYVDLLSSNTYTFIPYYIAGALLIERSWYSHSSKFVIKPMM